MNEREKEFLKLIDTVLSTSRAMEGFLETSCLIELDKIFGGILEKLNTFFKKVEQSFRDFVIFERYVTCAYTRELEFNLTNIPEGIKQKVWELRENTEICGFTEKECKCKKSIDYLRQRFLEKIETLASIGDIVRSGSLELKEGMKILSTDVASLTISANKIREIAETIEMIALNAYIEAARLGEQGRGFKVIADEIRKASMKTDKLASEIVEFIKTLQKKFDDQTNKHKDFDTKMETLDKEQKTFSHELNQDLIWMTQNFMDFLGYVRNSVEEDMKLLEDVRATILSVLQTIDLTNQRVINTHKALTILKNMIENFEKVLKEEIDIDTAYRNIQELYEEFKRIPKLRSEREIIAQVEGKQLDVEKESVGEKMEDMETDIELF